MSKEFPFDIDDSSLENIIDIMCSSNSNKNTNKSKLKNHMIAKGMAEFFSDIIDNEPMSELVDALFHESMEAQSTSVQIDLFPLIIKALGSNKRIHEDLDKLYLKNKYEFYKLAQESSYLNHSLLLSLGILQEEYARKALGILELFKIKYIGEEDSDVILKRNDYHDDLQKIFKKGWNFTSRYVKNSHNGVIRLSEYFKTLLKRSNNQISVNDIADNFIVLLFLSTQEGIELDCFDPMHPEILKTLHNTVSSNETLKLLEKDYFNNRLKLPIFKTFSEEEIAQIDTLKHMFNSSFGKVKSIEDIAKNSTLFQAYLDMVLFSEIYLSSIENVADSFLLEDRDLDLILISYYHNLKINNSDMDNINLNTREFAVHFISYLFLIIVSKAYKKAKEYHFLNNKETMFIDVELKDMELLKKDSEINSLKTQVESLKKQLKEQNNISSKKIQQQEKEISRLKDSLEKNKINEGELIGLRDMFFELNSKEHVKDEIALTCIEKAIPPELKDLRFVVVAGHPRWQEKMKTLFPKFNYLNADNLSFDLNLIYNADGIIFNSDYGSHGLYYKVINAVRKTDKRPIYISENNNIDITCNKIIDYYKSQHNCQ